MKTPVLLAIGGAHIDRRGRVAAAFVPGASNPGAMGEDVGGGAFNALRVAASRSLEGWLLSVRGGDAAGEAVARAVADAGIRDLGVTFLDRRTPSYTAILSRDGEVLAALADMELYEQAFAKQLRRGSVREAASAADALLCDANLPETALAHLPVIGKGKPLFAIAISPAKAIRLGALLPALHCLFLNRREAAALAGTHEGAALQEVIGELRNRGLRRGVVSNGAQPVAAFDADRIVQIAPPPVKKIADVTGAGDALAGATIAALMHGKPFTEAVREGMAAALITVATEAATPALEPDVFARALSFIPEAESADVT